MNKIVINRDHALDKKYTCTQCGDVFAAEPLGVAKLELRYRRENGNGVYYCFSMCPACVERMERERRFILKGEW